MKIQLIEFPGYSVDSYGSVYSTKRGKERKLKPQLDKSTGYLFVNLYKDKLHRKSIHRLVLLAFTSLIIPDLIVNHIDGNKQNNNLANLEWVTHSENAIHAYTTGLNTPLVGELHHNASINESECISLIQYILSGSTNQEIAAKFNLSPGYVSLIRGKRRWKTLWDTHFKDTVVPRSAKIPVRDSSKYKCKLDISKQISIINRIQNGETLKQLATEYGLDPSMLSRVKSHRTWKEAYKQLNNINV